MLIARSRAVLLEPDRMLHQRAPVVSRKRLIPKHLPQRAYICHLLNQGRQAESAMLQPHPGIVQRNRLVLGESSPPRKMNAWQQNQVQASAGGQDRHESAAEQIVQSAMRG